jgi:DNA-3-methyladenine glycosylase II
MNLSDLPDIATDLDHFLKTDPVFKASGIRRGDLSWRMRESGFPSLIRAILAQQVSVAAAASLSRRLEEAAGGIITPESLASLRDEDLRACGLSRQKISYARGLVAAMADGRFDPDALDKMTDEDATASLVSLKGFGVWSAQMVLIFSLGRRDIWPAGDLGIRTGAQIYLGRADRPEIAEVETFGDRFEGKRTAASLLLWEIKGRAAKS